MRRPVFVVLMAAMTTIPVSCSSAPTSPSTQPSAASTPTLTPSSRAGAGSRTIAGPSEDMQWGPVQVTITVTGKRLTDVQATAPTERERSAFINQQALPLLRQEALQAQSASINEISGATMTSDAYAASLQAALQQVGI